MSSRGRLAVPALALLLGGAGAASTGDERPTPLPARLGMTEAELRAEFGDALQSSVVERPRSLTEKIMQMQRRAEEEKPQAEPPVAPGDPFAEQTRLVREVRRGDVRRVEYELFRGTVYRIRWQLSDRFERPLMNPLVARLSDRFGTPLYDQQIEGKLGSGKATLRRTGWRSKARILEVRQLHPLVGGPTFLTLSDEAAMRAIVASRGTVLPEPESSGPWWQEPLRQPAIPTPAETERLLEDIDRLLSQIAFPSGAAGSPPPSAAK